MRNDTQLLRHCETPLPQTPLGRLDGQVQSVVEVGAGQGNRERYGYRRTVQLVDRHDREGTGLRLLGPSGGVGVSPEDIALLRGCAHQPGMGASNAPSIAPTSAL